MSIFSRASWGSMAIAALLLAVASPAAAHFVWVSIEASSSGPPTAHVWFSELAEPDSADLLDKIAAVKVWRRSSDGKSIDTAVAKQTKGEGGALVGKLPAGVTVLSAHINYGVLTRRDQTFLLHYHAKYLDMSASGWKALARDERLAFDIVPHATGKDITLEVLFQGKPAAGAEIVVFDPTTKETEAKTDAAGRVVLPPTTRPGLYSIRAKWVVNMAGKEGDKEYAQVNHYTTLALRVPQSFATAKAAKTAGELIHAARDARATWNNFSGFEADLALFAEGREQKGRVQVGANGEVTLSGFELKDEKSLLATLRSLVGHRMPGGESDNHVSFADEPTDHPLGRLIKLDYDSAMASAYRIKDDVIREVNRQTESGRFTISVFDVNRNAEGKYLPGFYTVSFWDKDGTLRSTNTVHETWVRVGDFDLPQTHCAVFTGNNERRNTSMKFSNHQLLK
jgi:hypothetical protein